MALTLLLMYYSVQYNYLLSYILHDLNCYKLAEIRKDLSGQFQLALMLGDVEERIKILKTSGQSVFCLFIRNYFYTRILIWHYVFFFS